MFGEKIALLSRSSILSPQLSLIWGCFSSKGTGELQVIHGSIYREILEKNLQKSATSLGHGQNFVLLHDNDPKHIAKLTKEWFENNGISTLN